MDSRKTILIADNDELNCKILESIVTKNTNHQTIKVRNGIEAVHHSMVNYKINLVLMDIKMPVLDGIEATIRIKSIRPNLPIIAVTALAMHGDRERILAAGCNEYVSKPIEVDTFIRLINRYLK